MQDELEKLRDELAEVCAQFELVGGNITEEQYRYLSKLKETGMRIDILVAIEHFKREKAKLENKDKK